MDWMMFYTVIGTGIAVVTVIFSINTALIKRLSAEISEINSGLKDQGRRTDKLYEMFVDLLKENKKK